MESMERNIRLFREMKELALKQQSSLQEDEMDLFSRLSRERDRLRSRIHVNRMGDGPHEAVKGGAETREKVREMVEVIRAIQQIDNGIREVLLRKKDALIEEIREIRRGKKAVKGYGPPRSAHPARFFDQKGF